MSFAGKRYWLVGASEGLGLALAQALSREGAEVILSARSAEGLAVACAGVPRSRSVLVDVADSASVTRAAQAVGDIDGLVFLAGVYWPMTAQAVDAGQLETMCNINFTGCARLVAAVLPAMVARGAGHLVLTGSLSGFRGLPGAVGYAASKAGVMALAESLYADLRGSGIKVQLANPGFIRTRLTAKNDFAMPFLMEPEAAAAAMLRLMQSDRFKANFPTVFSWLFRGGQFLPDWLYYRLFAPRRGA
ncbi:MAG: short-chain dehydrogenase/reductase SDR [Rhodobacteraceae bacterium]|uniref:SDR family NAD(P)-dependent oxidoreductase n=1 Tax=Cypionkella sp. TaxID=2811411 RepID=UPI00132A19CF|nr:SDR family NAD(P)-dependent oxidoreductase [Cypionkella sp.]KAF0174583.1 MAG: short-chain dehydrogenase/reductase SDR [Paracoccaceae bacterium]MDO8328404.1 SDR family NAD(P)-dependent oxidoreductase [Cypionkella sp.]